MGSEEEAEYLRLYKSISLTGTDVFRTLAEIRIKKRCQNGYNEFLKEIKHDMYHQIYKDLLLCCACITETHSNVYEKRDSNERLFKKFYKYDRHKRCENHIANNNEIPNGLSCDCICQYKVKCGSVDDLDLSDLNYLILHYELSKDEQEKENIKEIMSVRNKVMHAITHNNYTTNLWASYKTTIILLAGNSERHVKKRIEGERNAVLSQEDIKTIKDDVHEANNRVLEKERAELNLAQDLKETVTACGEAVKTHITETTQESIKKQDESMSTLTDVVCSSNDNLSRQITDLKQHVTSGFNNQEQRFAKMENKNIIVRLPDEWLQETLGSSANQNTLKISLDIRIEGLVKEEEDAAMLAISTTEEGNQTEENQIQSSKMDILTKRKECIVFEVQADTSIFESSEVLRNELLAFVRRVLSAGQVDTNVESTIYITMLFKSPMTAVQRNSIMGMLHMLPDTDNIIRPTSQDQGVEYDQIDIDCKRCLEKENEISRQEKLIADLTSKLDVKDVSDQKNKGVSTEADEIKGPGKYTLPDTHRHGEKKKEDFSDNYSNGKVLVFGSFLPDLKELGLKLVNTGLAEEAITCEFKDTLYQFESGYKHDGCLVVLADSLRIVKELLYTSMKRIKPTLFIYEDVRGDIQHHDLMNMLIYSSHRRPNNCLIVCVYEDHQSKYSWTATNSNIFKAVSRELDVIQNETDLSSVIWKACQNLQLQRQQEGVTSYFEYQSSLKEQIWIKPANKSGLSSVQYTKEPSITKDEGTLSTVPLFVDKENQDVSGKYSKGNIVVLPYTVYFPVKELSLKLVKTGIFNLNEHHSVYHRTDFSMSGINYDGCVMIMASSIGFFEDIFKRLKENKPTVILCENLPYSPDIYWSEKFDFSYRKNRMMLTKNCLCVVGRSPDVSNESNIFNAVSKELDMIQQETDLSSLILKACYNLQLERQQKGESFHFDIISSLTEKILIKPASSK